MNLESGTYYWPSTFPFPPTYKPLNEDLNCDVLIIGGGISGAQCAYYLSDTNLDVVVIEKDKICSGSTIANTALLQYSGEKMFVNLINTFGENYINKHLNLLKEALNEIEVATKSVSIDCNFYRRDTLYLASCKNDVDKLKQEYEYLKSQNFQVSFLSKSEIETKYTFSREAAIYSYNDGELNPFKYSHALFKYASNRNVNIYEHTKMTGHHFDKTLNKMVITTNNGNSIYAKRVIFAAGYEGVEINKEKKISIVSTYTITSNHLSEEELSPWYNRTLIWETARPYLYMRTTHDNRIIIGGLDEDTDDAEVRDSKLTHKKYELIKEFNKYFPSITITPDYYNSGFFAGTVDGLPIIGIYDDYPNCYFLFGFADNGTVYSQLLAKVIAKDIIEGNNTDLHLYLQNRPLKSK
jgi:glycine/D-amino acid oxidase-like deaminating enzyme